MKAIMANDRQPVMSCSCLIVIVALSDFVMKILIDDVNFSSSLRFGHFRWS